VLDSIPGRAKLLTRIAELGGSLSTEVSNVQKLPGDLYIHLRSLEGENVAKLLLA
jgi:hypothetical protein